MVGQHWEGISSLTFIGVGPILRPLSSAVLSTSASQRSPNISLSCSCRSSSFMRTFTPTWTSLEQLRLSYPLEYILNNASQRTFVTRSELTQNNTAIESEGRMTKTIESVKASFNTVRTGRASPSLLDRVMVDYYGSETPLNQVASVSISGTSTLVVEPYDKSATGDIERALMESNIGLMPTSDGSTIRLSVPPLTQERRVELSKQVKTMAEDGRVALRNIRRDAVDSLKKLEKKKEMGKDESKTLQDEIQKLTDKYVKQIESLSKQKEADILKV